MPPDLMFLIGIAIKMAVTTLFVSVATIIAEKLGPAVGGLVATLPVSAGPVYVFLALDHDAAFISASARVSLALNATTAIRITVYVLLAPRHGIWLSVPLACVSSSCRFSLWRRFNRNIRDDESVERYFQHVRDLAQRLNVAALAADLDLGEVALRDACLFGEGILADAALLTEERQRRFRCKERVNLGDGKGFFLAALNAGDGAAQNFGVGGIFVGGGNQLIVFLAGQDHDVVPLGAFGHHGHVDSFLSRKSRRAADIVNGDGLGGFSEQDAKILHAQPALLYSNQGLDVAGLRRWICRKLLNLGSDQLRLVGVAAKSGHRGYGVDDRFH
jgi:hypothetical protein